ATPAGTSGISRAPDARGSTCLSPAGEAETPASNPPRRAAISPDGEERRRAETSRRGTKWREPRATGRTKCARPTPPRSRESAGTARRRSPQTRTCLGQGAFQPADYTKRDKRKEDVQTGRFSKAIHVFR